MLYPEAGEICLAFTEISFASLDFTPPCAELHFEKLPLGIKLLQNSQNGADVLQNIPNGAGLPNGAKTLGGARAPCTPL